jgi:hypothetical protein
MVVPTSARQETAYSSLPNYAKGVAYHSPGVGRRGDLPWVTNPHNPIYPVRVA